ncbi:hypothetical protein PHET_01280 [Paragonimus heterotremus]|uniref:Uncharacterized protein n=1 Tax=Paragonimus heterotremus TaxID=100268 RepID=A0A8J4STL4_9TREM|nr:hypothetical protein PHET_01280 [Paragonimus heterotremus]
MKQWLQTPNSNVDPQTPKRCPTCRHQFLQTSSLQTGTEEIGADFTIARPVLSLRNFIGSMLVHCENTARGCTTVESVEVMTSGIHTCMCSYTPVDCAGCGQTVNRLELAAHQLGCFGIQAELQDIDADNLTVGLINRTDEQTQTETLFDKGTSDESQWLSTLKQKTTVCCCTQETQTEFVESECSTTTHKSTFVRELISLYLLNRSLVKLVYALKIELSTSQAELRLCKLKQKAVTHSHMNRVYRKTL